MIFVSILPILLICLSVFCLLIVLIFWYLISDFYRPPFPHHIRGSVPQNAIFEGYIPPQNKWNAQLKVRVWGQTNASNTIVFVHGWDSSMGHFTPHIQHYVKIGYRVVAVDFRSHGESEHKSFISVFNIADDIQSCLKWTHEKYAVDTLRVWAHSLGGVALVVGLGYRLIDKSLLNYGVIEGIYANGSYIVNRFVQQYSVPHFVVRYLLSPLMHRKLISTLYPTHPQYAKLKRQIFSLDDASYISPIENLQYVNIPLLSIHAKDDPVVSYSEFEVLAQRGAVAHDYLSLENGGHFKTAFTPNFFQLVDQKFNSH